MDLLVSEIVALGVGSFIVVFALKAYFLQRFLRKKLAEKSD